MCLACDIDGVLKESEGLSIELELLIRGMINLKSRKGGDETLTN